MRWTSWLLVACYFLSSTAAMRAASDEAQGVVFLRWLDDDHCLVARDGWVIKVAVQSGAAVNMGRLSPDENISPAPGDFLVRPGPAPWYEVNAHNLVNDLTLASPDGKWLGVVRKNDLYLVDKTTKHERRLTTDGSDVIFNGRADWVYYEEIVVPSRTQRVFYWSPDSRRIAFLRLDDTHVDRFTLVDATQRQPRPEVTTYPKVGRPNPTVKIGIAAVADQPLTWVDLAGYDPKDLLIARLGWHPDSRHVYFYAQNRIQTWLDLCLADAATGKVTKLFRDQTKAWIFDYGSIGPVHFLKDGTFLWFSARSGNKHLYRYAADGQLLNPVTSGAWDVNSLTKVDEADEWVYITCNKDAWLGNVPYRVKLDGTGLEPLIKDKPAAGTHEVYFSPGGKFFADQWSDFDTPPHVAIYRADGRHVQTMAPSPDMGPVPVSLSQEPKPVPPPKKSGGAELVRIQTPDGVTLAATVQLPPNFDPKKKYPVWYSGYGGPHTPTIRNAFSGKGSGDAAKAAQGYIVFRADPRSSSTTPHL
ncbi:MAG: DPP IV N-terminal domain-containing protein, partial [Gemmataceae bacterium]|nr:DPP IV N-terminal domain-containing protein [Gemmataceae bacterium]